MLGNNVMFGNSYGVTPDFIGLYKKFRHIVTIRSNYRVCKKPKGEIPGGQRKLLSYNFKIEI